MLTAGDKAPSFALPDQDGTHTRSSPSYKGRRVLVYFYPKADTPGCTQQACGLRDIAGDVGDTAIIGISPDKPAAQKRFDTKYALGFPLLSDVGPRRGRGLRRVAARSRCTAGRTWASSARRS